MKRVISRRDYDKIELAELLEGVASHLDEVLSVLNNTDIYDRKLNRGQVNNLYGAYEILNDLSNDLYGEAEEDSYR